MLRIFLRPLAPARPPTPLPPSPARFLTAWTAAVLIPVVVSLGAPQLAPAAAPRRGIDVSVHSGEVDWAQVAAGGHGFAFVKATEGDDLKDPAFDDHWKALAATGLTRGAYHFYVTEDDPEVQARFFIENVHLEPGDLAPVVDVELIGRETAPGLAGRLKIWLALVEAHYGVKPIIYTSPNFWDAHLTNEFGEYPLWVAEYGVEEPRLPAGWKTWHLWQWKENTTVPGVEMGADLSRVHPARSGLEDLLVPE